MAPCEASAAARVRHHARPEERLVRSRRSDSCAACAESREQVQDYSRTLRGRGANMCGIIIIIIIISIIIILL